MYDLSEAIQFLYGSSMGLDAENSVQTAMGTAEEEIGDLNILEGYGSF